jgi:iron-sulfur cluster assembly protein
VITLTPAAARQIRQSAGVGEDDAVSLRIAARAGADGGIEFGLGFDEHRTGDSEVVTEGITLLVAAPSREMVADKIIDYLEVEPGDFRFVFARAEGA